MSFSSSKDCGKDKIEGQHLKRNMKGPLNTESVIPEFLIGNPGGDGDNQLPLPGFPFEFLDQKYSAHTEPTVTRR